MASSRVRVFLVVALIILTLGISISAYFVYLYPYLLTSWQNTPVATPSALTENLDDPTASTAARIVNRNQLRVGIRLDQKPFGFLDANNQPAGFDVELAQEFAQRWLGDRNRVYFVQVTAADRIPQLLSGNVDLLLAALEYRRERDAFIDYSQEYYLGGQGLLTRAGAGIGTFTDLKERTVAAIQNSASIDLLKALADKAQIKLNIAIYQEYPQALAALKANQVDALTADVVSLAQFAQGNPDLQILRERLTQEPYAIGVQQGDSDFRDMVNITLQDMKKDGSYDGLYRKWFPTDEPFAIEVEPGEWQLTLNALPAKAAQPERTKIQEILERGRIVVGVRTDLPPFGTEEGGRPSGFDVDLVRELAQRWLGNPNAVDFVPGTIEEQIARLSQGQLDLVAAALPRKREWASQIDFSQTYIHLPQSADPYSLGLPHNDAMFRELVNVTLQEMQADGAYEKLFRRWFGNEQTAFALAVVPGDADYLLLPNANANQVALSVSLPGESVIKRIRDRNNVMLVGFNREANPFGFVDDSGQPGGFDVELVQALAQRWNVQLQLTPVSASDGVEKLVNGEIDLLAGALVHTKEREAQIDFSQTYFVSGQSLLVKRDANIRSIRELNGQIIAALAGSTFIDQIQAQADANAIIVSIQPFGDYAAAIDALNNGQVGAVTADNVTLTLLAQQNPALTLTTELFTQEAFGLGLPPADSYFNSLVNFTLQDLKTSGEYDNLYRKWFGQDLPPYNIEILPGAWPYSFADSQTILDVPVQSKVDQILARGKFIAGVQVDFKPFGFLDATGQATGFDVDIVKEFARRWLGDENAVELLPVTASNRVQLLVAGEVDLIAAAMTHNRERDELIDFSQTYFLDGQTLLVRQDSGVTSLGDLNNKIIAAIQGSTAQKNAEQVASRLGITLSVLPFQEYPPAVEALKAGQVDALTADSSALRQFAQDNPGLVVVGSRFTSEPYGLGVPNYDDRFRDLVNFTLQEMKADGAYDRLYAKWFNNEAGYSLEAWPGVSYLRINLIPMVHIPTGEFIRGNDQGFPDERPQQTISLNDYYIDQYEVTNRLYAQCVSAGRCTLPRLPRSVNFAGYYGQSVFGNYPAIWVSWNDASAFCQFMGKRLPSEAEWEKAARGPQAFIYPWGNDEPTDQTNFNYLQRDVAPVGSFAGDSSPYGVRDMAGNVREWVTDWYQWDYFQAAPTQNPAGPITGVTKVLRGGSWNDVAIYVRSTVRKNYLPDSFDSNLGFRCASSGVPTR